MHILHVVGARPNFMKVAPVIAAFRTYPVRQTLVHTGQHYDAGMSDVFFQQLGIPAPDINLAVGSGSHAAQTADIMTRFERVVLDQRPDVVLVYGDVNSTVATALVCAKLGITLGHVEAGLRSFDRTMPEEINRLVTDQLADFLFTPSEDGDVNLLREGIDDRKVFQVGNVMIDTLVRLKPAAEAVTREDGIFDRPYALVTLHRPANVDQPEALSRVLGAINELSRDVCVVFPVHPRTRARIDALGWKPERNVTIADPVGYIEFLALQMRAAVVITDSGGIQEETTFLGVPCVTVRANTERPVTVTVGTNVLVGDDMTCMLAAVRKILAGRGRRGGVPPLWDGHAASRIAEVVVAAHIEREAQRTPLAG
jgi:UDP-N-acetylglucosamine 2-epimerase (non-hydrolysing)